MENTNKYLVIGAYTNSDYDYCNAGLIELRQENIDWILSIRDFIKTLDNNIENYDYLGHISFYLGFCEFTSLSNDFDGAVFISEEEYNTLMEQGVVPEAPLDTYQIKFNKHGFYFTCYGKHTGDDYFTDTIEYKLIE